MSQPTGFFTLGVSPDRYQLPHRRLGLPIILLIRRVLCRAFEILREQSMNLADAQEDELTAALRSIIENDLRQSGNVNGFNRRNYESVIRQGEVANFDGTRRAKTPDLCFKLRYDDFEPGMTLSEFDALFVECKPVDATHPVGSKYCDDGLSRFVNGDYAWAMQEGMMLAYSRHGRTISDHLILAMNDDKRMKSLATSQLPQKCDTLDGAANRHTEAVHISKHARNFYWPGAKGLATEITVYHLWHDCN